MNQKPNSPLVYVNPLKKKLQSPHTQIDSNTGTISAFTDLIFSSSYIYILSAVGPTGMR